MNVWDRVRDELHRLAHEVAQDVDGDLEAYFASGEPIGRHVEQAIKRRTQRIGDCLARIRKVNEEANEEYLEELSSMLGGSVVTLDKDEVLH